MNGLITLKSNHSAKETIDKIEELLLEKGYHVFSKISHRENAAKNGIDLRPTELIIFGNPKVGTVLMWDNQAVGLDLPSKILAWEDESGQTHVVYNDGDWLAQRHQLSTATEEAVEALKETIRAVSAAAAK